MRDARWEGEKREGGEGGLVGRRVHRKSNRLWGCVWDGKIEDTEIEGGKPE